MIDHLINTFGIYGKCHLDRDNASQAIDGIQVTLRGPTPVGLELIRTDIGCNSKQRLINKA